ncbi:DUF3738 domain-containing protein [Pedobacter gandavensis]|uniref:DUF3738 domain-containing protein n=1 Tax=Pedobacter gandavensis TaxID=2679963 RepID=UPI002930A577|nr:DUF3738 domain-containing protein [Pedobacter gandavensis]
MKRYFILIIPSLIALKLDAQSSLKIGDSLPTFSIRKLINPDRKNISTADYKNQLLLVDFWSIYCSGCVAGLPKMEQLQQEFGDKIAILPVTNEAEKLVKPFWEKNKNTKNLKLPSVIEDTLFHQYFKHIAVPHEVWIYKNRVIAITDPEYVDAANIRKVLDGEEINWPVKFDFDQFDGTKNQLFEVDENQINIKTTVMQYAAISDYNDRINSMNTLGGGSGIIRDPKKGNVRAFYLNYPIYSLYILNLSKVGIQGALNKPSEFGIGPNEIHWEVKDPDKYKYEPGVIYKADWIRKNGICFESSYPNTNQTDKDIAKSILNDLDHLLGLQVRWEKRKESVYVLRRTDNSKMIKTKTPITASNPQENTTGDLHEFRNTPLSTLIYRLNQEVKNPYIFDQSGYKEKIDMILRFSSWTDIPSIRKSLQAYGLDLQEESQMVDKLVFREINGGLLY